MIRADQRRRGRRRRLGLALLLAGPISMVPLYQALPASAATPITCPAASLACDSFNRTVSNGWGSADVGGAWNTSGAAYSVSPVSASIIADATTPSNFLTSVSGQDVDLLAEISPPPISSTQTVAVGIGLRYAASTGSWYQVDAYYATGNNGGHYSVQLKRKPDNFAIRPDYQTTLAGGSPFWFRLEAQGTYPTSLRWKLWLDGTPEPSGWTDGGLDANAPQQVAGGVGVVSFVDSGTSSLAFNGLTATTIAATGTPITCPAGKIACDSFNRSVSNGWGSADVGGAWNGTGAGYNVSPANATIVAHSTTPTNFLASVSGQDVDVLAEISPPPISSTQTVALGLGLRYTAATGSWYQVDAYYATGNNGGNYSVQLKRKPDNVAIRPDFHTTLAGGNPFWLRFETQGIYPTTLRWKLWLNGTAEPSAWTDTGTDANPPQQVAGGVGVVTYVDNSKVSVSFNSLVAGLINPPSAVVACPASGSLACDSFNRTLSNGWGTADTGGAWNTSGPAYAVTPGSGTIVADSTTPANFLTSVTGRDVDLVAKITPPPVSSSQTVDIGTSLRYVQATGSWYQVNAFAATGSNNGNMTVQLKRKPDNFFIRPEFATTVPGGKPFWLRFEVQGAAPTTLRWRIWADGAAEPAAWTDTGTDSNPPQQVAGGVGVVAFADTGKASAGFNSFNATALAPPTCPSTALACDLFNRTVSAGWGSADVGGAWSNSNTAFSVAPGVGQEVTQNYLENDLSSMAPARDVDYLSRLTLAGSQGATCNFTLRRSSTVGSAFYFAGVWWDSTQTRVQLYIKYQGTDGVNRTLVADTLSTVGGSSPPPMWVRVQAVGANPTQIQARVWADGTPEPAGWQVAVSDSSAGVQVAGFDGFGCNSSANDTFSVNSILITALGAPPPPPPPPSACAAGSIVCDSYNRTVPGGWGSADTGGPWSILDTAGSWSVSPTTGLINVAATGQERADLGSVTAQDVEVLTKLVLPRSAQNNQLAYVIGRFTAGASPTYYRVGVGQGSAQSTVFLRAQRSDNTSLSGDMNTGIAAADGVTLWLRVQLQGINPTAIRARAWADGTSEPPLWTLDTTDSTAVDQVSGNLGLRVRNEDTAAAHSFKFLSYQAVPLGARPALPTGFATDTFNRTVNNGWGTADIGGAWSTGGTIFDVTPGRATIVASTAVPANYLTATSVQDVDLLAWISPAAVSGATGDVGVILRYTAAGGTFYQVSAYYPSSVNGANYVVQLKRKPDNVQIRPDFNTGITGGTAIWIRFEAQGINPTTLRWKLWQDGTPEPAGWTDIGTDSTPALQVAGGVGVNCYVSGGTVTPAFNAFTARGL